MHHHRLVDDGVFFDTLDLAVNVGTSTSINLYLYFRNSSETLLTVVELDTYNGGSWSANTWEDISIPLADIDMDNYTGTTSFHIESDGVAVVNFDNIEFVGSGGGAPNYANPHAPTTINGVSQTYDNNGNLTSTGAGLANTWNYQNRLIQSHGGGTASTTYLYDHTGQRTSKTSGGVTTHYPSALYEAQGATTTKNVYVGDTIVATIQSDTPAPKIFHNHLDHLGSTNVVSTPDGYLNQELSYYPFGSMRIENQYGELDQKNRYIGQDYDEENSMSYLQARYYKNDRGQFISQDPVFWEVGRTQDGVAVLRDPQQQNSYSYSANNPITKKDPSGRRLTPQQQKLLQGELDKLKREIGKLQAQLDAFKQSVRNASVTAGKAVVDPIEGIKQTLNKSNSGVTRTASGFGTVGGVALGIIAPESRLPQAARFFHNVRYSEKVVEQSKNIDDVYHSFSPAVDKYAAQFGTYSKELGDDARQIYEHVRLNGSLFVESTQTWVEGTYHFIKSTTGEINHRFFEPF